MASEVAKPARLGVLISDVTSSMVRLHDYPFEFFTACLQNTRETAHALRKMPLIKAKRYLEDVLAHKQAIPFTRFCRGVGRTARAKNGHSNGQVKGLDVDALFISHIQVNQAQKQRCRTYRLMGVSTVSYMSSPCHIELTLSEKEEPVKEEVNFVL
ncbi:60S ribosomal protein L17-2-like protein [Tanacetum coccineum]